MLIQKEQENTGPMMEKYHLKDKQINDDLILSDTLNFNSSSLNFNSPSASKLNSTLRRKRSLVSLYHNKTQSNQKINRTPSPKNTNKAALCLSLKDKSSNLKQNLLNQKFHQLTLNQTQKKPLKLKLSKLKNQSNDLIKQQLHDFSKEIGNRFENQNEMIKHSLQKMQNLITQSAHLPQINKKTSFRKEKIQFSQKQQIIPLSESNKKIKEQNENKIKELIEQNQKLKKQLNQIKNINNFLLSQNYKLSLLNSNLKDKVFKYEQKQSPILTENTIMNEQQSEQIQKVVSGEQFLGQTECETITKTQSQTITKNWFQNRRENKTKSHLISKKDVLINSIDIENFSLQNKHIQEQDFNSITNLKGEIFLIQSDSPTDLPPQSIIDQLKEKIQSLQQQILSQKALNDELSNQLAVLKLQNHGIRTLYKQNKSHHISSDSLLSIKIYPQSSEEQIISRKVQKELGNKHEHIQYKYQNRQHTDQNESKVSSLNQTPSFNQFQKPIHNSQLSLQNISHRASKSKILSNQIIYFAQTIPNQNQINSPPISYRSTKQQQNDEKSIKFQQNHFSILSTIQQQDQVERKKTLCMEKLKIQMDEIGKKRKSIVQNINLSLQKKQNMGKNKNNSLSFYSKQRVAQMEMIRETISLKFQAFKYTYEMFQNQIALWPNQKVTSQELKSILSEYPFLLQGSSIDLLLSYCDVENQKGIQVDHFCNKIREFIGEYYHRTEEEQMVLEKKILKRWKYTSHEVLESMRRSEQVEGEIRKQDFIQVLDEFKFEESEIHHLLSQSVAISPDINHIKYRQYLDNFLAII